MAAPVGRRQRWSLRVAVLGGLLVLAWALLVPPAPPPEGSRLQAFAPAVLATLEQEAWAAYYYRQWPLPTSIPRRSSSSPARAMPAARRRR